MGRNRTSCIGVFAVNCPGCDAELSLTRWLTGINAVRHKCRRCGVIAVANDQTWSGVRNALYAALFLAIAGILIQPVTDRLWPRVLIAVAFGVIYWLIKRTYESGGYHPVARATATIDSAGRASDVSACKHSPPTASIVDQSE